jgi:hypothetical protein
MRPVLVEREVTSEGVSSRAATRGRRSVTVNVAESPLAWLHARGHLADREFAAGSNCGAIMRPRNWRRASR